jgi:ABC-type nitrate/sulfonate/bicarbonate transport system substrate-binding protein
MARTLTRREFVGASLASIIMTACRNKAVPTLRKLAMQAPWVNDAEFIGYFVALQHDWYKDGGLDLVYQPGGPDVIAEGTLLSKRADLALTPVETTVNLIARDGAPLKIVGTQYQKSPLGIVSLRKNAINAPRDLIGKTLAVPSANVLTVDALFRLNGIRKADVKIVPYQYDPTPLLKGEVDATVDFVTNVPYSISQAGGVPNSFLIYDFGFKVYNDTVVVTDETLRDRRADIVAWIHASRRGWVDNFKDPAYYPPQFESTYFKGTGRTSQNEIFFNNAQRRLIESPGGIFSMQEQDIAANIQSLRSIGIQARRDMFVTDLCNAI